MTIDELLAQAKTHSLHTEDQTSLTIPKEWGQGRTVFGGLSAAILYAAIQVQVDDDRVMRSFNCNFVGPLLVDTQFEIVVEILRQGKNATQALGRIIQDGKTCVSCQVCFGVARKSKVVVKNNDTHTMEKPRKGMFLPQIPKLTPKFLRYYDLSLVEGRMPFTGSKKSKIHGWMRFKNPPKEMSDAHLISLIDAWPPAVLQMLRLPAPASTMSWNIEFIHPHQDLSPSDWFAVNIITRQAADGYAHTEGNIWDQKGELIAISRQTVGVFD
ncbi:thioesterase family protein [Aliiglaciecola sp. 3_MG-2023]|uniref:acyl-CoA thioesterase n=1 Tax=Aliiglaciecola sp. 3_MG-2023 TaxID=3062644 RepID=UPI0026E20B43|nr:thioesterase family protein [Aliiglaciecola sp. 3_MG-2023]MDO6693384.1 thioesterase family protein [Aliiglaciecola sp. 3_MG-2023]